jgi:hypothetical protein
MAEFNRAQYLADRVAQNPADAERIESLLKYNELLELQKESDQDLGPGKRVASDEKWAEAWREKEEYYRLKNARKESPADPAPLLMDKASTLPAGSPERIQAEVTKSTIDNTTSGVGSGLDTMTRESYKETKRLMKHSDMLQEGAKQPLPSADQIVGEEEGQVVSNLQSWKPVKGPMGADQFMPTSAAAIVDNITPHFTNQVDSSFKAVQMDSFQHMPAKSAGSLRNLATAADPALSVPFEIASDVYGGLLGVMDEIANLGDVVMAGITQFDISPAGGLQNSLFPLGSLEGLLGSVKNIAGQVDGLSQLLGGFNALSDISDAIGGIASAFSSVLNDPSKLAAMLLPGANLAGASLGCTGEQLGMVKTLKKVEQAAATAAAIAEAATVAVGVLGSLNHLNVGFGSAGKGLGNLGAILGGGISKEIGKLTSNIRVPEQIIAGILPPELNQVMQSLDTLPGLGLAGNGGFSVGKLMDSLADDAYSAVMGTHASHAAILSPNFNKQVKPTGSYAQDSSLDVFADSQFVKGAQGSKGITMLGPGSTADQKVFGEISSPNTAEFFDKYGDTLNQTYGKEGADSIKQQMVALDADAAMWRAKAAEARQKAATPTTLFG